MTFTRVRSVLGSLQCFLPLFLCFLSGRHVFWKVGCCWLCLYWSLRWPRDLKFVCGFLNLTNGLFKFYALGLFCLTGNGLSSYPIFAIVLTSFTLSGRLEPRREICPDWYFPEHHGSACLNWKTRKLFWRLKNHDGFVSLIFPHPTVCREVWVCLSPGQLADWKWPTPGRLEQIQRCFYAATNFWSFWIKAGADIAAISGFNLDASNKRFFDSRGYW